MHGGFGSADQAERSYGWNQLAEREKFVVACPDGVAARGMCSVAAVEGRRGKASTAPDVSGPAARRSARVRPAFGRTGCDDDVVGVLRRSPAGQVDLPEGVGDRPDCLGALRQPHHVAGADL